MSYLPPGGEKYMAEADRERQHLIELKAERYARLDQGDDDHASQAGAIRRALRLARVDLPRFA
jgi:hypothetical protein